jgi:hypothetical protein
MSALRFSIVMLLPDARGVAERSVRSWTTDQDFAHEQFELIAVSNGSEPDLDGRVSPLLRKADSLLQFPNATRTELYDAGACAARGEFVIFTESHCVVEPSCLSVMDRFLRSSGLPAACSRTRPLDCDALGRLDARCFEEGLALYLRPDDWRKVTVHAFAVRRDVYEEVGGLNPRYGIFAEMILAAELWRRGHRAGVFDSPPVGHLFDGSPAAIERYQADAVAGEMRYYRDHPRSPRIEHTFLADGDVPWPEFELELAAFAALWAERRQSVRRALRQGWRVLKLAARESRAGRAIDRAAIRLAATGCRVIGEKPALARRLFLGMWTAAARLARKEYLATEPPEAAQTSDANSLRIDEIPERDLWGFHPLEHWQGNPMRWTGRCTVIRLPRPVSACEVILQTNGVGWPVGTRDLLAALPGERDSGVVVLRGEDERACSFHVNGQRLPPAAIIVEKQRIRLRLEATTKPGPVILAVVCDPVPLELCGTNEPRELGFPLFRVETRAIGETPLRAAA